jgi:hypothetical protein
MSYLDRLPLYITDVDPEFISNTTSLWNFPMFTHNDKTPIFICVEKQQEYNHYVNINTYEGQVIPTKQAETTEYKIETSYYEWVDNKLEEMYLNEDGQYNGDSCDEESYKSCQSNISVNCENEEEELMFQFELDWDIEKGNN